MLSVEYWLFLLSSMACAVVLPALSELFFVFPDSASMPYTVGTTVKRAQVRKFIHDLAGY